MGQEEAMRELAATAPLRLHDPCDDVVERAIRELGDTCEEWAVRMLVEHVAVELSSVRVRRALAAALPMADPKDAEREAVLATLILLTRDEDTETRDMACFGLVLLRADTPVALDALAERLLDADFDTRAEALLGLAQAGDSRSLNVLMARLSGPDGAVTKLDLEAAAELADPVLYPLLRRLERLWVDDEDEFRPLLAFALKRCHPDARTVATQREDQILAKVNDLMRATGRSVSRSGRYPLTRVLSGDGERIWVGEDPWSIDEAQCAERITFSALGFE
jgi:HEAT repeat protein